MKKINRYVSYFEYDKKASPYNFDIKAFNEKNRKIKLRINEIAAEQHNFYILSIESPKTSLPTVYRQRVDTTTEFSFNISDLPDATYTCKVYGAKTKTLKVKGNDQDKELVEIDFQLGSESDVTQVQLGRAGIEQTDDQVFWDAIQSKQINFNNYFNFITTVLYQNADGYGNTSTSLTNLRRMDKRRGNFVGVNEYNMLKFGTEFFMLKNSALDSSEISDYLGTDNILPYYERLSESYEEIKRDYPTKEADDDGKALIDQRFNNPFFIELIWSYWMEQGMLMQAMNLINLRFQNVSTGAGNVLSRFDISPLRPLSHILWGFIQDEQHRLSLPRRVQEYDHEYGLVLTGKAVPPFVPADSRSKFLEAFHNLLATTSIFYKEADDTTRIADAFPVLNSLKEVHLLLAEGNHNAYGNLTWTARNEMLMTQYIIARDETRIFLGGRPMVPYPENWMDRVDTVRSMMGWGGTSITYFYDLAIHGEKILLSVRYGDWSDANMPVASAANWALAFRDSVQKYIHAYRTVTGIDMSPDASIGNGARNVQPAFLIQRRVAEERARQRRA